MPALRPTAVVLAAATLVLLCACSSRELPHYTPPRSTQEAEVKRIKDQAERQSLAGDHKSALKLLRRAQSITQRDPGVAFGIGTELRHLKRYDDAVEEFELVLWLDPNHPGRYRALGQIGLIRLEQGDEAAATQAFEAALEINPYDTTSLSVLLDIAYKQERYDDCRRYIDRLRDVAVRADLTTLSAVEMERREALLERMDAYDQAMNRAPDPL